MPDKFKHSAMVEMIAKECVAELRKHWTLTVNGPWVGTREEPEKLIQDHIAKLFPHQSTKHADLPSHFETLRRTVAATKALTKFGESTKLGKSPDGREFL
jgi:hypothetical protein